MTDFIDPLEEPFDLDRGGRLPRKDDEDDEAAISSVEAHRRASEHGASERE